MKSLFSAILLFACVTITSGQVAATETEDVVLDDVANIQVMDLFVHSKDEVVVKCKNIGTKPVKAFKGKWLVLDDFDEKMVSGDILFTSTMDVAGVDYSEGYLIQPNEVIYLDIDTKSGAQRVLARRESSSINSLETVPATWKKRFKTVITKVILADREDLDYYRTQEQKVREAQAEYRAYEETQKKKVEDDARRQTEAVRKAAEKISSDLAAAPRPEYDSLSLQRRYRGSGLFHITYVNGTITSVEVAKSTGVSYLDKKSVSWIKSRFRVKSGASGQATFPMDWNLE